MSELRDARLQRALQEAPDAQLRPSARTRAKVLEAARRAETHSSAAPPAWWQALWSAAGSGRGPWSAALASVVLATLVTVLWWDRETPGPRSDGPQPGQGMPVEPSAPAAVPVPAPPAAPATQAALSAATAAKSAAPAPVEPAVPAGRAQPQADRERQRLQAQAGRRDAGQDKALPGAVDTPSAAAEAAREQRVAPPAPAAREQSIEPPAQAAPGSRRAAPAPAADQALRDRAAAAAAVPPLAGASVAGLTRPRAAAGPPADWTGLRLADAQGNRIELSREQAPRLAELAQLASRVAREAQGLEPLADPVEIRIELRRAGQSQALLEVAGAQVRWTVLHDGSGARFTARPPAAQLQALREEAARFLRR